MHLLSGASTEVVTQMVVEFGAGGLLKMTGQQWCGSSSKNVVASLGLRELFCKEIRRCL